MSAAPHPAFLPLGLLGTSALFDLVDLATGTGAFNVAAYWMLAAGLAGGLLVAPIGWLSWRQLRPGTRERRLGALLGLGHALVLLLFAASWLLREPEARVPGPALALSLMGGALALLLAWLGSQRASRHDSPAGAH